MEEIEIWKEIEGYEGFYSVSNTGRVKRHFRMVLVMTNGERCQRPCRERILKLQKDKVGYLGGFLFREGKKKPFKVHRLVGLAFIDNPENKPEINHKDGIKGHNKAENLEWMTRAENVHHAHTSGIIKKYNHGESIGTSKITAAEAYQIKLIHKSKLCKRPELAKLFGIYESTVGKISRGVTWKKGIEDFLNKVNVA